MSWYVLIWGILSSLALFAWALVAGTWWFNLRRGVNQDNVDLRRQVGYLEAELEDKEMIIRGLRKEVKCASERTYGIYSP